MMGRKKFGFSFIELILILVFFFLILAALMPMITRRHLAPPTRSTHGTYACYWETQPDGSQLLKETLVKGRKTIIDNEEVDGGCYFEAPRKAKYFYVQIIGGGGGGRDLDWDLEVNPETVEKYRVYGVKEMSPPEEGFFVSAGTKMKPYNIHISTSQYLELLEPYTTPLLGIPTKARHVMYLHGTSEAGGSCTGSGSSACEIGEIADDDPWCEAKISASDCTELKLPDNVKKSYSDTYWYPCKDNDGDYKCDDASECYNSGVICVKGEGEEATETEIKFDPQQDIVNAPCPGGEPGAGMTYYKPVGIGGLSSVLSDDVFTRHDENHPSFCRTEGDLELNGSDYNAYYGDGSMAKPFVKDSASLRSGAQGKGVWFGGRFIDTISPLYVCGGRGGELGVTLSHNPRSGSPADRSGFCSPAYGDPNARSKHRCEDGKYHNRNGLERCQFGTFGAVSELLYGEGSESEPSAMRDPANKYHHDYLTFRLIYVNLWQHQEIPYGVGGRAGELKTLILKSVPDGIYMMPGKGGEGGLDPKRGEDTIFGSDEEGSEISRKIALGGDPGQEVFSIDAEIGPYSSGTNLQSTGSSSSNRTTTTADVDSRQGGTISYSTFVKFVISYTNKELKQRMEVFGRGGDGAATATDATCGYQYFAYALHDSNKDPEVLKSIPQPGKPIIDAGTFSGGCNGYAWQKIEKPSGVKDKDYDEKNDKTNGYYWGYYPEAFKIIEHAQDGQTGAIVISW